LTENLEFLNLELDRPIFIVGAPRSGTTLLYHLLGQNPDLGWFSKRTFKKFFTKEDFQSIHLRRRIFEMRDFSYNPGKFDYKFFSTVETPVEAGELWDMVFKGNWVPRYSKDDLAFFKKIIIETLSEQKKKRFLSKFPRNSIRMPTLNDCFPNSKFINILRDGRAVVNSMIRRADENPSGYFGIPLKKSKSMKNLFKMTGNKEEKKIHQHATQWKHVVEEMDNTSKKLKKNQFLTIRYEDLVSNTEDVINQVTKFCELPSYDYAFIKDGKGVNIADKDIMSWEMMRIRRIESRNKSHENDKIIEKYLGASLKEHGYPKVLKENAKSLIPSTKNKNPMSSEIKKLKEERKQARMENKIAYEKFKKTKDEYKKAKDELQKAKEKFKKSKEALGEKNANKV